jgi:hypothetical protein
MTTNKTPTAEVAILMAQLVYFTNVSRELREAGMEEASLKACDKYGAIVDTLCDKNAGNLAVRYQLAYDEFTYSDF